MASLSAPDVFLASSLTSRWFDMAERCCDYHIRYHCGWSRVAQSISCVKAINELALTRSCDPLWWHSAAKCVIRSSLMNSAVVHAFITTLFELHVQYAVSSHQDQQTFNRRLIIVTLETSSSRMQGIINKTLYHVLRKEHKTAAPILWRNHPVANAWSDQ